LFEVVVVDWSLTVMGQIAQWDLVLAI